MTITKYLFYLFCYKSKFSIEYLLEYPQGAALLSFFHNFENILQHETILTFFIDIVLKLRLSVPLKSFSVLKSYNDDYKVFILII